MANCASDCSNGYCTYCWNACYMVRTFFLSFSCHILTICFLTIMKLEIEYRKKNFAEYHKFLNENRKFLYIL